MNEKSLNITFLKKLIYEETEKYYKYVKEKSNINNLINFLNELIRLINEEKYDLLKVKIENMSSLFENNFFNESFRQKQMKYIFMRII